MVLEAILLTVAECFPGSSLSPKFTPFFILSTKMRFFAPSSGTSGANYLHKLTHGPRLLDLEGRESDPRLLELEGVESDPRRLELKGGERVNRAFCARFGDPRGERECDP